MQYRPTIVTLGLLVFLSAPMSADALAADGAQPESHPVEQATARSLAGYWTSERLQAAVPSAIPALSASEVRTEPRQDSSGAEAVTDIPGTKSPRKLAE